MSITTAGLVVLVFKFSHSSLLLPRSFAFSFQFLTPTSFRNFFNSSNQLLLGHLLLFEFSHPSLSSSSAFCLSLSVPDSNFHQKFLHLLQPVVTWSPSCFRILPLFFAAFLDLLPLPFSPWIQIPSEVSLLPPTSYYLAILFFSSLLHPLKFF